MSDGAVTDPSLNRTEHVDENISAKRVVPYFWDGSNLVRQGTQPTERYDYSGNPIIYVGQAPAGSSEGSSVWTINKFDLTTSSAASGKIATSSSWTGRAAATYV